MFLVKNKKPSPQIFIDEAGRQVIYNITSQITFYLSDFRLKFGGILPLQPCDQGYS